ncbi:MAG TPA: glycerol kinase [Acidimicrobiales bacterium]|nr:glycerol kinase [Acidimicrobiales bacterium]
MGVVLAIDAGTTGVRTMAFDEESRVVARSYRELTQYYPRPGWVEHDAAEIRDAVWATLADVAGRVGPVAAVGITNQRETVVAWDTASGEPLHRAIVWQDRRTADRCAELTAAGHLDTVRRRTGLVLDPYFSATKMEWLLGPGGVERSANLALGTVDAWLIWNLTGELVTDVSNASRTLVFDIRERRWDPELAELFGVPLDALPEVRASSGHLGATGPDGPLPPGVPVSGVAGDQQAALFGQACFGEGTTKNTYGTGSFVLMNVGDACPEPVEGLLTSVAWELADGSAAYALEGSIFVTGAALQWLRDGLAIVDHVAEIGPLAGSVESAEGLYFVPALAGMGSPYWDPTARGVIVGITNGSGRAQLARAAVDAMAHQTRDVVEAMTAATGQPARTMRVDGGAAVMDLLLQVQADQLGAPVGRPVITETTSLGAAWLAGLGTGVWSSLDELEGLWTLDAEFHPAPDRTVADAAHQGWVRAVGRARSWAR